MPPDYEAVWVKEDLRGYIKSFKPMYINSDAAGLSRMFFEKYGKFVVAARSAFHHHSAGAGAVPLGAR